MNQVSGLTQQEASALFKKHGFAPQTTGGWARRLVPDPGRHWRALAETPELLSL